MNIDSIDEEVLPHQKEDFQMLFDQNPSPMWVLEEDSLQFLLVNSSALKLYGYSREEFLSMSIKDLWALQDSYERWVQADHLGGEAPEAEEWLHLKKDGSEVVVETVSRSLPAENGTCRRRMEVVHDITSRKHAEKKLAESETHARSILNNLVEVVFSFNENMEMTYISAQCQSILGFKPEDFYSDKFLWFSLVHPLDKILFEEALPKIKVSSEQFIIEYRVRTASGEEKWLITRCAAQLNEQGRMVRMDGSANDISSRKRMEEKIRFADFSIERASEAFLWTRSDGTIIRVNRAACSIFGYQEQELLGLPVFALAPKYTASVWLNHWEELEKQKNHCFETELKSKEGQLHPVELHMNYFYYGEQGYGFMSIRRIGERKLAEAERAVLLEETARQNEHLRQFAYIVSHNLRAPVANIVGLTHLYNRTNPADPINAVLISKLERTTDRLDATIKDLNEILTVRSAADLVLETVDLPHVLKDVEEAMGGQLARFSSRMKCDFTSGREILGVKGYVHSIFLNLITNAIKYRAEDQELEIHIKTVFSNGFLCLQIQDNGLGIDLVKQGAKVFGLYRRFHPHIEGKGLGLHMIKTQVESMGGWVDVESEIGKGSTFKVFFQVPLRND